MHSRMMTQRGHAAMLFAMMVPVLSGIFILGTDGARALQYKARMMDASEAAILAISAHAASNSGEQGSDENRQIAADFYAAYFPDLGIETPADMARLQVVRLNCEQIDACRNSDGPRFFQYQLSARLSFPSWFPGNDAIVGFGETIDVSGDSTSRKYQSNAIDVMLAADFSGSMDDYWDGGTKRKYQDLIDIVLDVADELDAFNSLNIPGKTNTLGIAPYSHYVRRRAGSERCNNKRRTISQGLGHVEHLRFQRNRQVDYPDTISKMQTLPYTEDDICAVNYSTVGYFHSIPLTHYINSGHNNAESFITQIRRFWPKGGTASYLGLIESYKLLQSGTNSKKLLIILSDGVDTGNYTPIGRTGPRWTREWRNTYAGIGNHLVIDYGLCEKIKSNLSVDGDTAEIYMIGFDYQQGKTNTALDECVGEDNIFYARNKTEILNRILSLVAEEIGHLKQE
ncbi:von Willebrand factor type A domain protein [Vibrio aerogenes CECT 7868]|uniref:von Willebrand factor type A domain protein n=1 Tax=Vibrio aerogenes CECT 7868 TaxID=1216006 RepID=A0A1M5ZSB2_9VIBR|nr:TadE/TadG family type IV pilus assembly protein [Vibrio aerogenes]SHI26813.1 von Willebrand factor type A domain protein [Vibrio aerogenes CECT 7868]